MPSGLVDGTRDQALRPKLFFSAGANAAPLSSALLTVNPACINLDVRDVAPDVMLWIDGAEWSADVEGAGPFRIPLPPIVRNSLEHRVRVEVTAGGGRLVADEIVCSKYQCELHIIGNDIVGWIRDVAYPSYDVTLDLFVDDVARARCVANRAMAPGENCGGAHIDCGFLMSLNGPGRHQKSVEVSVRIAGTDYSPFGDYIIGLRPFSYSHNHDDRHLPAEEKLYRQVVLPAVLEGLRASRPVRIPLDVVRVTETRLQRSGPPLVDVIIPVYRGIPETIGCIESVIAGVGRIACNIVVLNDASPEAGMAEALRELAHRHTFRLIENARNLGFTATVNLALEHGDADAVVLNADTLVPAGWLDRLYAAAYSEREIATVTAFSNNAGICSLPDMKHATSALPYGLDLAAIDNVVSAVNAGVVLDLPTSNGFCMFIKREAIQNIGVFNAEKFPRGYGEENDFSIRAASRGWRNVIACDVFVQHIGSVSFAGESKTLTEKHLVTLAEDYPDYPELVAAFIEEDPLSVARNRILKHLWPSGMVVLVSLALGGGVARHVAERAASLAAGDADVLILSRSGDAAEAGYTIAHWHRAESLKYPGGCEGFADLICDLTDLHPSFIEIHHVIDMEDGIVDVIAALAIPYSVSIHDYFYLCPRVTLLDDSNKYCGVPDLNKCNACIIRSGVHEAMHSSMRGLASDVGAWRRRWSKVLRNAVTVSAPSEAARAVYHKVFGELPIQVAPHYHEVAAGAEAPREHVGAIRVGVIGAIGPHKGFDRLLELVSFADKWAPDIEFVIVGFSCDDARLSKFSNTKITGPYKPDEIWSVLKASRLDVALFLSPWPETYCYTLSEALAARIVPVALDLGALGERLRKYAVGELFAANATNEDITALIRRAADKMIDPFAFVPAGADLTSSGERAPPPPAVALPISLVRSAVGLFPDGWVGRRGEWLIRSIAPLNRIGIRIWIPALFAGQHVDVVVNGRTAGRWALATEEIVAVEVALQPAVRVARVELAFDFTAKLEGGDQRCAAGVIVDVVAQSDSANLTLPHGLDLEPDAASGEDA